MIAFIVNVGSTSLKIKIYSFISDKEYEVIGSVFCDNICYKNGQTKYNFKNIQNVIKSQMNNHESALKNILINLKEYNIIKDLSDISFIGYRVVHGFKYFTKSVLINPEVLKQISLSSKFAPLHNPPVIKVIKYLQDKLKNCKHIASFDTAFHRSIPLKNSLFAIPYKYYKDYNLMRYGAHGISYKYINLKFSEIVNNKNNNLIVCHLGGGASICAIKNGKSYNTSMGLTPLGGIFMATRSGDIDPSVLKYICEIENKNIDDCINILNNESGLLGISNYSSDMRKIFDNLNNDQCRLSINLYCKQISEWIIKYINELKGKVDAIVFTGGIGENNQEIRLKIINNIKILKILIDSKLNNKTCNDYLKISSYTSLIPIFIIKTNEELMIFKDSWKLYNE